MEVAGSADTSTATEATTGAGRAYIKPLGKRYSPQVLATVWEETHLPRWFGLSTFEVAIVMLRDDVLALPRGAKAKHGPSCRCCLPKDRYQHDPGGVNGRLSNYRKSII